MHVQMEGFEPTITGSDEDYRQLAELVDEQARLDSEVRALELQLAAAKRHFEKYANDIVPAKMREVGTMSFVTVDGNGVEIATFYNGSLGKGRKETEEEHETRKRCALYWLQENGHEGIIRSELKTDFPKGDAAFARKVRKFMHEQWGLEMAVNETIHPSTLKAFVKEQVEQGTEIPRDLFKVNVHRRAVIKHR